MAPLLTKKFLKVALGLLCCLSPWAMAAAADGPKSPEEFAAAYMGAFNKKDLDAVRKLRYPVSGKSEMQDLMNSMAEAELSSGTQYNKFEIQKIEPEMDKPSMGPDGVFYKPNLPPTNVVKFTSVTKDGTSSTSFPIGSKGGIYYQVGVERVQGDDPVYHFGWARFTAPASNWSVMFPNEPDPGRAALEKQFGSDAFKDPDIYGVVKNTSDIKTTQHWFRSGEEGKRLHDEGNKEIYRAACTTYTPETLQKWFSSPKKNLDDAVDYAVRANEGKLVQQKDIDLAGSPGREFEIVQKDGALLLGRAYWVKDALYELTFESRKENPDRAGADKFLSSLEVQ